ncbi:MAG: RDD family protein [Armatimonadota bacterium]
MYDSQMPVAAPNYASVGKRFAAAFVDGLIVSAAGFFVGLIFGALGRVGGDAGNAVATWLAQGVGVVMGWLYYALQESSPGGATVGKRALGIRVQDEHGYTISFAHATGRYFGRILSTIPCLFGYIMAFFTPKKQALHDMLVGAVVVDER